MNGKDLGNGLVWPPSNTFTHIDEARTEAIVDDVGQVIDQRPLLSPAMKSPFLAMRKQALDRFLSIPDVFDPARGARPAVRAWGGCSSRCTTRARYRAHGSGRTRRCCRSPRRRGSRRCSCGWQSAMQLRVGSLSHIPPSSSGVCLASPSQSETRSQAASHALYETRGRAQVKIASYGSSQASALEVQARKSYGAPRRQAVRRRQEPTTSTSGSRRRVQRGPMNLSPL